MLRNRNIEEDHREKEKGIINRNIKGLKGKGGSVKSLFEELYSVEEVYKADR